jgi:hypothetical protein
MDLESVETKPTVQESIGIFQLIDQLETAVDKLLERQVYFACRVQVWVIKTNVAIQYCSKCRTLPTNLQIRKAILSMLGILFFPPLVLYLQ